MSSILNTQQLTNLPREVRCPCYDRNALPIRMIHLGVGAFHRAHQAYYTEALLNAGEGDWGILGVSLRHATVADTLAAQDGLYTVVERDGEQERLQVVGSLRETLYAGADPGALVQRMADPRISVVSLTVTEKGYCHDPATGRLHWHHPDIVHDLAHPHAPRSAVGFLVAGLWARQRAGDPPFTVLCCDNLPHNGRMVAGLVDELARYHDAALADWIQARGAFPGTMVDRIVPATTEADRASLASRLGMRDEAAVVCEPFTQWVIEDRFAGPRPAWERVGAQLVEDVAPFETMKLRLLNGSHSTLAYLGYLAGFETISETVADPAFQQLVVRLMSQELAPTLTIPADVDLSAYQAALLQRFANRALHHRCWQIAMDGSQKLPQRLLAAARERLQNNQPVELIALGVAGWMRYVTGVDEQGGAIDVRDPLAEKLAQRTRALRGDAVALAEALLAEQAVFGEDLAWDENFREAVESALESLLRLGARATVARYVR